MASPATTERTTPSGRKMDDGYQTLIAFNRDPDVLFWEKTVQPPGDEGGDPIDTTTMHNVQYRSKKPRSLEESTDIVVVAAYCPEVREQIRELINQEGSITVHYPDGSTEDVFGFLKSFIPQPHAEGAQPEAQITIVVTNWDPVNSVEAGPVVTEVPGT